ncbi:MAG TPA: CxxC-x17-CxxC domain-containing protein [Candidatus Thermoplasmatota archaeon]|nr:CxxC-x17-CxxC domain-containing protein [Candidatus Thermoplasmatota archaeon]
MAGPSRSTSANPRPNVPVTCSGCGAATTVPFTPTPGRPVYCRDCFAKKGPSMDRHGPPRGAFPGAAATAMRPQPSAPGRAPFPPRPGKVRKLAQGRKAHFVFDVREILSQGPMIEENRRVFIEMLFIRGARQGTESAYQFLEDKVADKSITDPEAVRIGNLVDKYSFWQ